MKKILIITASLGNGHNIAALGILQREEKNGNIVEIIYTEKVSFFAKIMKYLFGILPESVLNILYDGMNCETPKFLDKFFYTYFFPRLKKIIKNSDADEIIFTFPAFALLIPKNKIEKITIQVTDYLHPQKAWLWGNFNKIIVLDNESKKYFSEYISPEKIEIQKFPLVSSNENLENSEKKSKIILLFFHFILFGNEKEIIQKIQKKFPEHKLIILSGKNYKYFSKLYSENKNFNQNNIEIIPWINQNEIQKYYEKTDIVAGKCGGAFISEVMQRNMKLIITGVFSRQEEGNFEYLEKYYGERLVKL